MMEYVNCNLCGKNNPDIFFRIKDYFWGVPGDFSLVRCDFCWEYLGEVLRKSRGKVLDVGCGDGEMLEELTKSGD